MGPGSLTQHIDLAQIAFWAFFVFFVGLVWFNRREDKREGYPMKESPYNATPSLGWPAPPEHGHAYQLMEGGTSVAPHDYDQPDMRARPLYPFDGTPLVPVGNPLLSPLGPGAWVMRPDMPQLTEAGELNLQPLRLLPGYKIADGDADPRGMTVFDWRWVAVGVVHDIWIDQSIEIMRLLEVGLWPGWGHPVLVPIYHATINEKRREVRVTSLRAHQFADVPRPASPDRITAREDERLNAYYAAGRFYRETDAANPPPGPAPSQGAQP